MPKWRDIKDVTKESVGDIRPTLISGGFPCQPFSVAGNQRGKSDDRYLWPEQLRIIREFKPRWFMGENVPGIIKIALDDIIDSIEGEGYSAQTYSYSASIVGACHKRDRVFVIAHPNNPAPTRQRENGGKILPLAKSEGSDLCCLHDTNLNMQYSKEYQPRDQQRYAREEMSPGRGFYEPSWKEHWITIATRLCRVDDGVPSRVDRLKCLGNAVVPQQVYPILKAIADIERGAVI